MRGRRLEGKLLDFSPGRKSQYEIYTKLTEEVFSQQSKKRRKEKEVPYKPFGNPFFLDVKIVDRVNRRIP